MLLLKIIIILFFLYLFDTLITRFYCAVKKKKSKNEHVTENLQEIQNDKNYQSLKSKIKPRLLFSLYYGWMRYKLQRLGRTPCHTYRNFILRNVYLMDLAKTAVIYGGFEIRDPWRIHIGAGTIIGDECKLDGRNGIIIGENANLSTGVWIWTKQHELNHPFFESKGGAVHIDDRAWISSRTTILPGVHVAEGCVLAAGAVAVKSIDSKFTVWGGIPARQIGLRNNNLKYTFDGSHIAFW